MVASRTVGFPVGHASAQLAWRGLRCVPRGASCSTAPTSRRACAASSSATGRRPRARRVHRDTTPRTGTQFARTPRQLSDLRGCSAPPTVAGLVRGIARCSATALGADGSCAGDELVDEVRGHRVVVRVRDAEAARARGSSSAGRSRSAGSPRSAPRDDLDLAAADGRPALDAAALGVEVAHDVALARLGHDDHELAHRLEQDRAGLARAPP